MAPSRTISHRRSADGELTVKDQPKQRQASPEDEIASINGSNKGFVGRVGLEPATYGLSNGDSQRSGFIPVGSCARTHFVISRTYNIRAIPVDSWSYSMNKR
jgi:hypothetical protein